MGTILMQDTFLSAVTEGRVDPAFHPSRVGKMGTVYSQEIEVVNQWGRIRGLWSRSMGGRKSPHPNNSSSLYLYIPNLPNDNFESELLYTGSMNAPP